MLVGGPPPGLGVAAVAVGGIPGLQVQLGEITVSGVAKPSVVAELVADQGIAPLVIETAAGPEEREVRGPAHARRALVGEGHEDHAPGAVVDEAVVDDRVVSSARDRHSRPHRTGGGEARGWHVGVVVVVHVVVGEHPAVLDAGDGRLDAGRAGAVLRRRVVAVLAVGVKPILVVVELGVLDQQATAGVGARVADRVELRVGLIHRLIADLPAGPDVVARVVEVGRVGLVPGSATPVAREDAVGRGRLLRLEVGAGSGQKATREAVAADPAAVVAAVPPDLVTGGLGAAQEVACGEVLDRDVWRLVDHQAVETGGLARDLVAEVLGVAGSAADCRAGLGPIHDHGVAVHAAEVDAGLADEHTGRELTVALGMADRGWRGLVVARSDENPVSGVSRLQRGLDGRVLPANAVIGADAEYAGACGLCGRERTGEHHQQGNGSSGHNILPLT